MGVGVQYFNSFAAKQFLSVLKAHLQ